MFRSSIVLAAIAGALAATPSSAHETPPLPLSGWEYRWDEPTRDEQGRLTWPDDAWKPTAPFKQLPDRNGRERAWFRVNLPQGEWVAPTVFIEGVDTSFEAFVLGHQVYSWGNTGEGPEHFQGWPWHLIPVHPDPGDHHLYLRVRSTDPNNLGIFGRTVIGNTQDHIRSIISRDLFAVFFGLTQLGLGIAALIVFLGRREQRAYLFFALFVLAEAATTIAFTDIKQLAFDAPEAWRTTLRIGRLVAYPMLLAFAAEVMGLRRSRLISRVAAGVVAIGLALLAFAYVAPRPGGIALTHWANATFIVTTIGAVVASAIGVRHRARGARWLLAAIALMLVAAVHDLLVNFGIATGKFWFIYAQVVGTVAMSAILLQRFMAVFDQLRVHAHELEQRNARLAEVEAELQRAVRSRDEFLSIASHELRNPMATISADLWLLERESARDPRTAEPVKSIVRQVRHLTRLVDDMLDAGRIARGVLTLRTEPVELQRALQDVLSAARASAAEKRIEVRVDAPLVPIWTRADPTRLEQILGNIVRNAIKYTPDGGAVQVSIARERNEVLVRVRDTGVGMSAETLARLFRLFERGDSTVVDGMGVGLALVRSLVELHGGTVTAQSDGPGKGSEFQVRLPACEAPEPRATKDAAIAGPTASLVANSDALRAPSHPVAAAAPASPQREAPLPHVLLIDDNQNLRRSLRIALQLNGFQVAEAEDGAAGLERLLGGGFDAAVVDLRMPGLDGCEVARRVRASELGDRLKLIALTGHAQAEERARAEDAGFDQVLLKPTDPNELSRLLADRADSHRLTAGGRPG